MFIQIGAKPESDFSEPLGMLTDCHRRIKFFLSDLVRLAEDAGEPLDAERRRALERALRYFQESGPRHTADEEESLFPRLRAKHDPRLNDALERIKELESDHDRADIGHAEVDAIGNSWLAAGTLGSDDAARLRSVLRDLSELYEHHIGVEDTQLFPVAASLLSGEDQLEVGREMAERRGLSATVVGDKSRR